MLGTLLLFLTVTVVTSMSAAAAEENPDDIIEEFPPLPEDEQLTKETGKKIYRQSCANCHGANGEGGYLILNKETPPLAKANKYLDDLSEDFGINDQDTLEQLGYATIREHTREPPGVMASAIGTDGWSTDTISEQEADAIARWLMEDAPEAPQPSDFEEEHEEHEESVDQLKTEFPMLSEDEQLPLSEGEKLFERSCANCHEAESVTFAAPPGVPTPGEKAPPLAPFEREEDNLEVLTYYHFREHTRVPPGIMAHFLTDTLTNDTGFTEATFTEAEADAISRFIATNEGQETTVNEDTGLPPEPTPTSTPTATATATATATQEPMDEDTSEGQTSPGFTWILALTGILGTTYFLHRYNKP